MNCTQCRHFLNGRCYQPLPHGGSVKISHPESWYCSFQELRPELRMPEKVLPVPGPVVLATEGRVLSGSSWGGTHWRVTVEFMVDREKAFCLRDGSYSLTLVGK